MVNVAEPAFYSLDIDFKIHCMAVGPLSYWEIWETGPWARKKLYHDNKFDHWTRCYIKQPRTIFGH